METLPEPQDQIKSLLSWFMSDEDVACYSDVAYALEMVRRGGLCWQAAVSIGVHALKLGVIGKTDEEKALAENLVDRALEPSEALHESLTRQAGQQPLTDEQGRMLFHVRFGLWHSSSMKGATGSGPWGSCTKWPPPSFLGWAEALRRAGTL
jgi:hypothetical protein